MVVVCTLTDSPTVMMVSPLRRSEMTAILQTGEANHSSSNDASLEQDLKKDKQIHKRKNLVEEKEVSQCCLGKTQKKTKASQVCQ